MRRCSRAGGKPAKSPGKQAALNQRNAPRSAVRRIHPVRQETEVARLTRERDEALERLSEALEQQTATSEVLRVVSSSPSELEPVFQAMLENATRVCGAKFGILFRYEGGLFHQAASLDVPPWRAKYVRRAKA